MLIAKCLEIVPGIQSVSTAWIAAYLCRATKIGVFADSAVSRNEVATDYHQLRTRRHGRRGEEEFQKKRIQARRQCTEEEHFRSKA